MKKGYLFICLAALGFGTEEIAGKSLASANMDPAQVMFLAFFVGALVLLPLAIREMRKKQLKLGPKDFAFLALEGILCVPISMFCLQLAVTHATAAKSAVVFCSNAIWTIPISMWLLKAKVTKFDAIATVIAIIGVIVIYDPVSLIQGNSASGNTLGMTYALISAVTWSFFTVIGKKRIGVYGGYVFNFFAFAIGIVVLLAMILIQQRPILSGINTVPIVLTLLYMGIFIKGISYIFYFGALQEEGAVKTSMTFLIKPALATILAAIILHEAIQLNMVIGIILIIAASSISFYMGWKAEKKAKEVAPEQASKQPDNMIEPTTSPA